MKKFTIITSYFLFLFLLLSQIESHPPEYKFEGLLGSPSEIIENRNDFAPSFLPYNPTVIEIGSYEGEGTIQLAEKYPYGKIYCFEPNPRAFAVLQERIKKYDNVTPINQAINT